MNQYAILSTTTVFLVDSSTVHQIMKKDVLMAIIETFLSITVLDITCTVLAI